jgi:hypothetical protein
MDLRCSKCKSLFTGVEHVPSLKKNGKCPRCPGTLVDEVSGPVLGPAPVGGKPPVGPKPLVVQQSQPVVAVGGPKPVGGNPLQGMAALGQQALAKKANLAVVSQPGGKSLDSKPCGKALSQTLDGKLYQWDSKFDLFVSRIDHSITVIIRIKVVSGTGVASSTVTNHWASKIVRDWQGFQLTDDTGQVWRLGIKIEWVDSGQHYTVTCNKGVSQHGILKDDGTEHVLSWGDQDGAGGPDDVSAISHEVGHMIGNCDQYGNITKFSARATGVKNYGAVQNIATKRKVYDQSKGAYVEVAGPRVFGGVKNEGIMGNPAESPKCHNWFLVGREFSRMMDPKKPVTGIKISLVGSKDVYTVEAA